MRREGTGVTTEQSCHDIHSPIKSTTLEGSGRWGHNPWANSLQKCLQRAPCSCRRMLLSQMTLICLLKCCLGQVHITGPAQLLGQSCEKVWSLTSTIGLAGAPSADTITSAKNPLYWHCLWEVGFFYWYKVQLCWLSCLLTRSSWPV